jgi:hypothetical protein
MEGLRARKRFFRWVQARGGNGQVDLLVYADRDYRIWIY